MTIFIADHLGALKEQSAGFRPIHIGAKLATPDARGPEPDLVAPNSISAETAYADLRMLHHVRHVYDGLCEHAAIMQYRRMFLIGDAAQSDPSLRLLHDETEASDLEFAVAPMTLRAPYIAHLLTLPATAPALVLGEHDFVANKVGFVGRSVQAQYVGSIKLDYPNQPEYVDAWFDLRRVLEAKFGESLTSEYMDGGFGYMNNCFISSWPRFTDYCDFLFEVFDQLSGYRSVHRIYGYLAERIFAVYLAHHGMAVRSQRLMYFD